MQEWGILIGREARYMRLYNPLNILTRVPLLKTRHVNMPQQETMI